MSHTIPFNRRRGPMWVFEENYRLLHRLLPDLEQLPEETLLSSEHSERDLHVAVAERCRYTTMLTLRKAFVVGGELLPELSMELRVYDDARVVEVCGYQGCERIPARYQVGDGVRYKRDEKRQVNQLLRELLEHCLRFDFQPLEATEDDPA